MVLSLAVGVSATSKPAGIYVLVHGTSSQSDSNINLVATTSWVDKNPDSVFFLAAIMLLGILASLLPVSAASSDDTTTRQSLL